MGHAKLPRGATAATPRESGRRLWEIDVLRTVAIGMMVVYHVGYDVDFLAPDVGPDPFEGFWRGLQVATGSTFLALVGVSFWIAHERSRARGLSGVALWVRHARRGVQVLAAAALVSAATFVALGGDDAVRYGILHLIATAILIVLPATVALGAWNALLGVAAVAVGVVLKETGTDVPALLVLGFDPGDPGVDWYPLLPWIGASLLGVAAGSVLYPGGERAPWLRRLERSAPPAILEAPGRHSLAIYLVHQPVLIALTAAALALTGTDIDGL